MEDKKIIYRAEIGRQLALYRAKRGLTTRQLAELAGISYSNINKIERGSYNVSIDILGKICNVMECSINILDKNEQI